MTHLKIVVVALVAAIAVVCVGITARVNSEDGYQTARVTTPVVKAQRTILVTNSGTSAVR